MGEGNVDYRGNLEVGGSEDSPEADTHTDPTRNLGGDKDFSGSTSGGKETEGENVRSRD